ncbi:MAG: hypothetical protein ACLGP3_00120, partial [Acidobacteriota bacterium]
YEWWDMTFRYPDSAKANESISGHDLLLGAGADIAMVGRWSLRLQYEHLNLALDAYGAGVAFRF